MASTRGLSTKGFNRDQKRSFVKHRSVSHRPHHRLSEGEEPLSSITEAPFITKHFSSSSLVSPRLAYDLSSVANHPTSSGMRKKHSSPEGYYDRSPPNSKLGKELSPPQRTRISLSPDPHSPRAGKTLSPDLYRTGHNPDQWDCIASSQSESSVDLLSGSCDSLDNVTTAVNKSSPPIKCGESSTIKVLSVDKKQVIRNLASITSITLVDEGNQTKEDSDKDNCSPCGPHDHDAAHDLSDMPHNVNNALHEPTDMLDDSSVSHDPATVPCDPTSVSHDLVNVSHDSPVVSHNPTTSVSQDSTGVSHDPMSESHDTNELRDTDDDKLVNSNRSFSVDSNISSQSVHVDFLDSSSHSLEDIKEETNQVLTKQHQHKSLQSNSSVMSIGKFNALHNNKLYDQGWY